MYDLGSIPFVPGHLENVSLSADRIGARGWMFHPEEVHHSILILRNGSLAGAAQIVPRDDVARAYPWIKHARRGFSWSIRMPETGDDQAHRIDVLACQEARPVGRLSCFVSRTSLKVPVPPETLIGRVIGTPLGSYYRGTGLQLWEQYHEFISRHRPFADLRQLLDWGCGCGRISGLLLSMPARPEIFGCDVDTEAVSWCAENLPAGNFTSIPLLPPTSYEDAQFDAVIASSIFTHLERTAQEAWLEEMRRVIAPGGIFVATIHGNLATRFSYPDRLEQIQRDGIWDDTTDPALDEVTASGYYRSVYQTLEYTRGAWGAHFEILEHAPGAIGTQDVIIMRRPA